MTPTPEQFTDQAKLLRECLSFFEGDGVFATKLEDAALKLEAAAEMAREPDRSNRSYAQMSARMMRATIGKVEAQEERDALRQREADMLAKIRALPAPWTWDCLVAKKGLAIWHTTCQWCGYHESSERTDQASPPPATHPTNGCLYALALSAPAAPAAPTERE